MRQFIDKALSIEPTIGMRDGTTEARWDVRDLRALAPSADAGYIASQ